MSIKNSKTNQDEQELADIKDYIERARTGKIRTRLKDGDLEKLKSKMLKSIELDVQQLVASEKFISGLLLRMPVVPVRDCRVDTALTDGTNIYFDIDFYSRLNHQERVFVLAHEVWHNALLHFIRRQNRVPEVWNIATDCEINYALSKDGFVMPKGLCFPCKNDEGKCAEDIYDHLIKEIKKNQKNGNSKSGSNSSYYDSYSKGTTGKGYSQTGSTDSPSNSSGDPSESNGDKFSEQFDQHSNKETQDDDFSEEGQFDESGKGRGFRSPTDKWGEKGFDKDFKPSITDSTAEKIREMVISEAQRHERTKGSVPDCIKRIIEQICKPEVDWREHLSQFVSSCLGDRRQWLPPLRRGVYNEMYFQSRRSEKINVTCIVDTSGSTSTDLPKFLSELVSLLKTFGRYELTLIHCDCEVHRVDTFDEYNPFPVDNPLDYDFEGGGGSSLLPAFNEIMNRGLEPSCNIVFTDGYIDCPQTNPLGCPSLFILTTDADENFVDWGKKIRFKERRYEEDEL